MNELLRLNSISKAFAGVQANDKVDLSILEGEIHVLLGENGAGKTTLMNCVYGLYTPDCGQIGWQGKDVRIKSIKNAIDLGISMVHQHFMLVHNFTVIENIVLGLPSSRKPFLDTRKAAKEMETVMETYSLQVDLNAQIWQLSVGQQQRVEILKSLYRKAKLLIFDEPTAVLAPSEVEGFFEVLKRLRKTGHSVILITHKLDEVMKIADRATVMRNGRVVGTVRTEDTTLNELVSMMVGKEIPRVNVKHSDGLGNPILTIENLRVLNHHKLNAVDGVGLQIRKGEILGIAGVAGNGQTELAEALTGLRPVAAGRVTYKDRDITGLPPGTLYAMGISHIPEDRQANGLIMSFSVAENTLQGNYDREPYARRKFMQRRYIQENAGRLVHKYDIKTPDLSSMVRILSGGNQQKIILARELERKPELLIAVQPTRGLDIGAAHFVQQQIVQQKESGAAVLYISTELSELLELCDHIAVLYKGQIAAVMDAGNYDIDFLGRKMAGVKDKEEANDHA
ncbi:MAG: ABC transporter ATP-binding protein [Bacillota bacterium]